MERSVVRGHRRCGSINPGLRCAPYGLRACFDRRWLWAPAFAGATVKSSHRRQQLVAAVIGVELSAALPLDRGTARGGRDVGRDAERAAEAIRGTPALAGGKRRACRRDAEHQKGCGDNLDRQSHGTVLPKLTRATHVY